ncbi:MAG: hypothetical protein ISR65_11800 [Bacteriovoracaceae bacterium]|nr:hypothetical protein [Bacteriovoracaceae bacterium]
MVRQTFVILSVFILVAVMQSCVPKSLDPNSTSLGNAPDTKNAMSSDLAPPTIGLDQQIYTVEDIPFVFFRLNPGIPSQNEALNYTIVTYPQNGVLSGCSLSAMLDNRDCRYTPDRNFYGQDYFTYRVRNDRYTSIGSAMVIININSANDPPSMSKVENITIEEGVRDVEPNGITIAIDEGGGVYEDSEHLSFTISSNDPNKFDNNDIRATWNGFVLNKVSGIYQIPDSSGDANVAPIKVYIRSKADDMNTDRYGPIKFDTKITDSSGLETTSEFFISVTGTNAAATIRNFKSDPNETIAENTFVAAHQLVIDEGAGDGEDLSPLVIKVASSNITIIDVDNIRAQWGSLVLQEGACSNTLFRSEQECTSRQQTWLPGICENDTAIVSKFGCETDGNPNTNWYKLFTVGDRENDASSWPISLKIIPFQNTTTVDPTQPVTITVDVTDDSWNSWDSNVSRASFLVNITPVNQPPIFYFPLENKQVLEGSQVFFNIMVDEGGGADEDSQRVNITITSGNQSIVANDNISINGGSNSYTTPAGSGSDHLLTIPVSILPAGNNQYVGDVSFQVVIKDDAAEGPLSDTSNFTVNWTQINNAPSVISKATNQTAYPEDDPSPIQIKFVVDEGGGVSEDDQKMKVKLSYSCANDTNCADAPQNSIIADLHITPKWGTTSLVLDPNAGTDPNYAGVYALGDSTADAAERDLVLELDPNQYVNTSISGAITFFVSVNDEGTYPSNDPNASFTFEITPVNNLPIFEDPEDIYDGNIVAFEGNSIPSFDLTIDEGGGIDEDDQNLIVTITSAGADDNDIHITLDGNDVGNVAAINGTDSANDHTISIVLDIPFGDNDFFGQVPYVVELDDGTNKVTQEFIATWNAVDDDPQIINTDFGAIINPNEVVDEGDAAGIRHHMSIDEGGGSREDYQNLKIVVASDKPEIISNSNISLFWGDRELTGNNAIPEVYDVQDLGVDASSQPLFVNIALKDNVNTEDSGPVTITLAVSDKPAAPVIGADPNTEASFTVTINQVNDHPRISYIADQSTNMLSRFAPFSFNIDEGGGANEDDQGLEIKITTTAISQPNLLPYGSCNEIAYSTQSDCEDANAIWSPNIEVYVGNDLNTALENEITGIEDGGYHQVEANSVDTDNIDSSLNIFLQLIPRLGFAGSSTVTISVKDSEGAEYSRSFVASALEAMAIHGGWNEIYALGAKKDRYGQVLGECDGRLNITKKTCQEAAGSWTYGTSLSQVKFGWNDFNLQGAVNQSGITGWYIYRNNQGPLDSDFDFTKPLKTADDVGTTRIFSDDTIQTASGIGSNIVRRIVVNNGSIHAATLGGLSILTSDSSNFKNLTTDVGIGDNQVTDVFVDGQNIYLGTDSGLSISTDGGSTFVNRTDANGLDSILIYTVTVDENNNIFAATGAGLSISEDSGRIFTNLLSGDTYTDVTVDSSGKIYAASQSTGIYISTDGGSTFANKNNATNSLADDSVNHLTVADNKILASTPNGLSISEDQGQTFTTKTTNNGLGSNLIHSTFVDGTTIYAATDEGLSISTDGSSFGACSFVDPNTATKSSCEAYGSCSDSNQTTEIQCLAHGSCSNTYYQSQIDCEAEGSCSNADFTTKEQCEYYNGETWTSVNTWTKETWSNKPTWTSNTLTKTDGLASDRVFDVYVDENKTIFAATEGGISVKKDGDPNFTNYVYGDEGKVFWYQVRPVLNDHITGTGEYKLSSLRVVVPPTNKALVHRWIVNQDICGRMQKEIQPFLHYQCDYIGPGNTETVDSTIYDLGYDIIVDRFESGCNYDDSTVCGGFGCIGLNTPTLNAPEGSIYYNRANGTCYANVRDPFQPNVQNIWKTVSELSALDSNDLKVFMTRKSNHAKLPPLTLVDQSQAQKICASQENKITVSIDGNDISLDSDLLTRKEQIAASSWSPNLSDTDIDTLERGQYMNTSSKCNTYNGHELFYTDAWLFSEVYEDVLPFTSSSKLRLVTTGSTKTKECVSRYGIQDMVGNVREWTLERMYCSPEDEGATCEAVTFSKNSDKQLKNYANDLLFANDGAFVYYQLDGITGPCADTYIDNNHDDICDIGIFPIGEWKYYPVNNDAWKFFLPVGLPADDEISSEFDALSIGNSETDIMKEAKFHGDKIAVNSNILLNPQGDTVIDDYYLTAGNGQGVTVGNNRAFVADGPRGVVEVNLSDMSKVRSYEANDTDNATALLPILDGNDLFVAYGVAGLLIIDTTTHEQVELKDIGVATDVVVRGDYAYVATGTNGVSIIDLSGSDPNKVGEYKYMDTPSEGNDVYNGTAISIDIENNYLFIADGTNGLTIAEINTSDGSSVTSIAKLSMGNNILAQDVFISNDYAYVSCLDSGLKIVNKSNLSTPVLLSTFDTNGQTYSSSISGDYAYIADGTNGMLIVDISNPLRPIKKWRYPNITGAVAVFTSDKVYTVNDSGLMITKLFENINNTADVQVPGLGGFTTGGSYLSGGSPAGHYTLEMIDPFSSTDTSTGFRCVTPYTYDY